MALTFSALACPECATGIAARRSILEDNLALWLLVALAPFLVIGVLSALVHRIGRRAPEERIQT